MLRSGAARGDVGRHAGRVARLHARGRVPVVVGREGAVAELKAASNCGACHKAHKGKGGAKKEEKKAEEKPAE